MVDGINGRPELSLEIRIFVLACECSCNGGDEEGSADHMRID